MMTIAACEAKCSGLAACTAITVDTSGGTGSEHECYRRADVVLSKCDDDGGYDTYTQS